jgi:hypothetical protein
MAEMGAHDDEKMMQWRFRAWLREPFVPQYCNLTYQPDYDVQYCIVGFYTFMKKLDELKELYKNPRNDFFFIDDGGDKPKMCALLDKHGLTRMNCYSIKDLTVHQMTAYFDRIYRTCEKSIVMYMVNPLIKDATTVDSAVWPVANSLPMD